MNSVAQRRLRILCLVERLCELRAVTKSPRTIDPKVVTGLAGLRSAPALFSSNMPTFERLRISKVRFSAYAAGDSPRETSLVCHQRLLPQTTRWEQRTNLFHPRRRHGNLTDPACRKSSRRRETLYTWIPIALGSISG